MQKISSYLYPNRLSIVADLALFPVRWNIVYQNRIKIYKGVDNVLTLDVKNADQKRIDIANMDLKMSVTDVNGLFLEEYNIVPSATIGLATTNIPECDLELLDSQFLNFTIYRVNHDASKTIFYADTQFGAVGQMELVGSAIEISNPDRYITRFSPLTNTEVTPYLVTYYSDAVEIKSPNYLNRPENTDSLELEFFFNKSNAAVTVQATKDPIISSGAVWTDILSFGVFPEDTTATKIIAYPKYDRSLTWLRVKFEQTSYNGQGATVDLIKTQTGPTTESGFKINRAGLGYQVGEVYTIPADRYGGGGAWQLTVAKVDSRGAVSEWTVLAEPPVSEGGSVTYKDIQVNDPNKVRSIDKVIVRV